MFKRVPKPVEVKPKKKIMSQQNVLVSLAAFVPLGIAWITYRTELAKTHGDEEKVAQDKVWHWDSTYKNMNNVRWADQKAHNRFADSLSIENARKLDILLAKKK